MGCALKSALRESCVVLMVRCVTLKPLAALTIAETGHLVFATHTNSASQTADHYRCFSADQQAQIRSQLAMCLLEFSRNDSFLLSRRTCYCGRSVDGNTSCSNLIREAKSFQLDNVIQTSSRQE